MLLNAFKVVVLLSVAVSLVVQAERVSLRVKGQVLDQFGKAGVARVEQWERLVFDMKFKQESEQLVAVNGFFNQLKFVTDDQHWGQEDYWATPIETLASNGGDCEDFAIAKYATLQKLGVSVDKMRITYVKATKLGQPHMVLTYYPILGEPLILDILVDQILPASLRKDLIPVYSFNAKGLWQSKTGGESRLGDADDIDMWRDLKRRSEIGQR